MSVATLARFSTSMTSAMRTQSLAMAETLGGNRMSPLLHACNTASCLAQGLSSQRCKRRMCTANGFDQNHATVGPRHPHNTMRASPFAITLPALRQQKKSGRWGTHLKQLDFILVAEGRLASEQLKGEDAERPGINLGRV